MSICYHTTHVAKMFSNRHLLFYLALIPFILALERPKITIPLGEIAGYNVQSFKRQTFSAFEGIPYGKPPIGPLRFAPPEEAEPWPGTWQAVRPTVCAQTEFLPPFTVVGDEDCLHLNVYVPKTHPDPNDSFDVIVNLHGGAFTVGYGHGSNPSYLMDKQVILVTVNYRVGILGFLSTEDGAISGNMGLKDQVLALKWVQKYIKYFGGNPDSVTIQGMSAGGASVHYHLLSKMSKGLFHRAVAHSSTAINNYALQKNAANKAKLLAISVGCPQSPSHTMAECLRSRTMGQLVSKLSNYYAMLFLPLGPFAPVVESGKDAFIDTNPFFLLHRGQIANDVPTIMSVAKDEGLFPTTFFLKELELIDQRWDDIAPFFLNYNFTLSNQLWAEEAQAIRKYYIGENVAITPENQAKLIEMFGDRYFVVDVVKAAKYQAKSAKSPVYFYVMGYANEKNPNKTVAHAEDLKYYYQDNKIEMTTKDLEIAEMLQDMLVSFAKTGEPKMGNVEWPPTAAKELTYLNITNSEGIKVETRPELAPAAFWKSLNFMENDNLVFSKDEL